MFRVHSPTISSIMYELALIYSLECQNKLWRIDFNERLSIMGAHPNRLIRFPSEQRARRCYIEKDKTEPFHKTKLNRSTSQQSEPFPIWTENSALLHRKKQSWSVPHPNRLNCFPCHGNRLTFVILSKTDPFHIPTDWTFSHLNRELDVITAKWCNRKHRIGSRRCYIDKHKTEPLPVSTKRV